MEGIILIKKNTAFLRRSLGNTDVVATMSEEHQNDKIKIKWIENKNCKPFKCGDSNSCIYTVTYNNVSIFDKWVQGIILKRDHF